MTIAQNLADFAARLDVAAVPPSVLDRARLLVLDAIGVALASSRYDFAGRAIEGVARFGAGDTVVIGTRRTLPLRDAVLVNGILVHGLDYDDTYLPGSMHLTASTVPTALGVAATAGASGRELLAACVVGLEVGARLAGAGKGGFQHAGFHATGVCAAFSCALVAGKLMRLSPDALAAAQGVALSMASGTLQPLREGAWTKRMHPGWAGVAGVTAAGLADAGFVAPREPYEGMFGFYKAYLGGAADAADLDRIGADLGQVWELGRSSVKLYPAGHLSHAFMTATLGLVREHDLRPEDVQSVHALVGANAIPLICEPPHVKARPTSSYMAQFSLQYGIACCIARRAFGLDELEPDAYDDPALHALAGKVTYAVDPDAGFPAFRSGEVRIRTRSGTELRRREVIRPEEPEPADAIVAKFMDNAGRVLPRGGAERLRDRLLRLEDEPQARVLAADLAAD